MSYISRRDMKVSMDKPFKLTSLDLTGISIFADVFVDVRITSNATGMCGQVTSDGLQKVL